MTTEKSELRRAREAARLSRAQVAEKLGTTVHLYWHCEMPPYDGPADVLQAACALLGVATSPQGEEKRAEEGAPRGPRWWRCPTPTCGHREQQYGDRVWHACPPKGKKQVLLELELPRRDEP